MDQILLGRDVWIKTNEDDEFHRAEIVIVDSAGPGISVIFSEGNKKGILRYYPLGEIVDNTCFSFCKPDEPTYKIRIISCAKIIPTIKILRKYTNYELKETKVFLDSIKNLPNGGIVDTVFNPNTGLKEKLNKETAHKLYNELREIGCDVKYCFEQTKI